MIKLNKDVRVKEFSSKEDRFEIAMRVSHRGILEVANIALYFDGEHYYVLKNRYEYDEEFSKMHNCTLKSTGIQKWCDCEFLVLDEGVRSILNLLINKNSYFDHLEGIRDFYTCTSVIITDDFLFRGLIK